MLNTPILFLIFNRPDVTQSVFDAIKKAKPTMLFIAADGPRETRVGEVDLCEQALGIVKNGIDWECELNILPREKNLGCKIAVSSAITWFFSHVEEGIILEDDVLPDGSFFDFCSELLEKYRYDERVMLISGSNLLGEWKSEKQSYFAGHIGIWGWASWRRAWELYDITMQHWDDDDVKQSIKNGFGSDLLFGYFNGMFDLVYQNQFDTWDVQWAYSVLINRGVAINPAVNLVKNIGFGANASHTFDPENPIAQLTSQPITFPLLQPQGLMLNVTYLETLAIKLIGPPARQRSLISKIRGKFKSLLHK